MAKFSKDRKDLEEIKNDRVNFEFDLKNLTKVESTFFTRAPVKCYVRDKIGHKLADCRFKKENRSDQQIRSTENIQVLQVRKNGHLASESKDGENDSLKYCNNCKR